MCFFSVILTYIQTELHPKVAQCEVSLITVIFVAIFCQLRPHLTAAKMLLLVLFMPRCDYHITAGMWAGLHVTSGGTALLPVSYMQLMIFGFGLLFIQLIFAVTRACCKNVVSGYAGRIQKAFTREYWSL